MLRGALKKHILASMFLLLGAGLIFCAFFFQPWVELKFTQYIINTPKILEGLLPQELVVVFLRIFKADTLEKVFSIITKIGSISLSGLSMQVVPTYGFATRVWILAPLFLTPLVLIRVLIGFFKNLNCGSKAVDFCFIIAALTAGIGLLVSLPEIDALGLHQNFAWTLLAAFLGIRIGNGPWITILGLILLQVGSLMNLSYQPQEETENSEELGGF